MNVGGQVNIGIAASVAVHAIQTMFSGCYAASLGMARSINRKNRVSRARATTQPCDLTPLSTPAFATGDKVLIGANCVTAAGRPRPIKLGAMSAVLHSSVP